MTPLTQDFIKGYDPTGAASISPSQLAQMVDAATPAADKGLWITTTDDGAGVPEVPDASEATGETKFQNYGWKRISANAVSIYVWNPSANDNVVYQKWVNIITAQYAPQTIPGSALVNSSIGDAQVGTISSSKISGLPTVLPPTGNAGGDLDGSTYPNPVVKALAINGGSVAGKIANLTINDYNIANVGITPTTKLALAAASVILKMKSDGSVWEVKDYITGNGAKGIRVNAGATDFEAFTLPFSLKYASDATTTIAAAGTTRQFAHGLAAFPSYVRVVLVAGGAPQAGYTANDEVDPRSIFGNSLGAAFSISSDATNVNVTYQTNGATNYITNKTSAGNTAFDTTKWTIKVYAAV